MDTTKSYVFTPAQFQYHYQTVPERMELQAKLRGEKEVYVFLHPDGKREAVTAAKLYDLSMSLAKSLVKLGVKKGEVVAIALANDLDCLVSIFGVIIAGALSLCVTIQNDDGSDVKNILHKSGAVALIIRPGDERKELNACLNFIDDVKPNGQVQSSFLPSLKYLVSTDHVETFDFLLLDELIQQNSTCDLPMVNPEDPMVMFTTSGSTGVPKLVPQSHHFAMILGFHLKEAMHYDLESDVIYSERRFAWIGGFPFMYLHDGVKVVTKTLPFSSYTEHCKFTYNAIRSENCTVAALLPATVVGLLEVATEPYFLLNNIHTGGYPVPDICMDTIGKITKMVSNSYGSSESGCCSTDHITDKGDFVNHSSGFPHQGVEIKIVGKDGGVVKRREIGTVYVRSPSLFRQYFKDEKVTKDVLSLNHWMNTDDIGYIDDVGRVIVSGRCSEIIMQSGRYIIPSTMEAFIKKQPDVLDAVVVSVQDDAKFQLVAACVIPKEGRYLSSDDLFKYFTTKHLSSANEAITHSYPELVFIFDEFPKLYSGKPDKKKLKLEAARRARECKQRAPKQM